MEHNVHNVHSSNEFNMHPTLFQNLYNINVSSAGGGSSVFKWGLDYWERVSV